MKKLIVDFSPILYSNLFSATAEAKRNGAKPIQHKGDECPKIPFVYKDILFFKVLEELSGFKNFFGVDEVILGFDNSMNGYWRKRIYDRYKYGRAEGRDTSDVRWGEAFEAFNELRSFLTDNTSYKTLSIEGIEGDDIMFVLSKYFSDQGDSTVLHSLDHDIEYCLEYKNVEYFKTRKTQKLPGHYIERTQEELDLLKEQHKFIGDKGDGFGHVKWWTKFSKEFLIDYPKFKGKELQMYPRHHDIEKMYQKKMDALGTPKIKAYAQPRFGWKGHVKTKKTIKDVLNENPIHQMNYDMNKKLALPDEIPQDIRDNIIKEYDNSVSKRQPKEIKKFLDENSLFKLIAKIPFF